VLAAPALGGCLHGGSDEPAQGRREPERSGRGVTVVERSRDVGAAYVAGDRAYGLRRTVRLAAGVDSTLIATLSPAAVVDPTRRFLAYNSMRGPVPLLRLHDLETGEDTVLERGAFSIAWRREGWIAYFKGRRAAVDLAARQRPHGHVVVRGGRRARAVRWTRRADQYVVAAWAQNRLLAYRIGRGRRWPDLLALDGPRRSRVLAERSGLVAVSPDGRQAMVSVYGAKPPLVRVLDIASGRESARLRLDEGAARAAVAWVTEAGSWSGDLVFAKASPGVVVFRVQQRRIAVEQLLAFDGARFPLGIFEPRAAAGGRRVLGWAQLEQAPGQAVPDTAVVACDRMTRRCEQGPVVSAGLGLRLIYNPSRP
jgi:hypothetical protein